MGAEYNLTELINIAKKNMNEAISYELKSDDTSLAREIYSNLFDFYREKQFSGDVIFTWRSPSLVKNGYYCKNRKHISKNRRTDNKIVIGNIFPNFKTNEIYSLNCNRNACFGDFPHDYFDIYLDHIAKYAYNREMRDIKEYYPLKRAIIHKENADYFHNNFKDFDDFLAKNFLTEIWEESQISPFSDMDFDTYQVASNTLMENRGELMLKKLIQLQNNKHIS